MESEMRHEARQVPSWLIFDVRLNSVNTVEICNLLRKVCCRILVQKDGVPVDFGTGTLFSNFGAIITARHIVSDGFKLTGDTIAVAIPGRDALYRYRCVTDPALAIDTGAIETRPFPIDLAVLLPDGNLPGLPVDFVPLRTSLCPVGEDVVIAGFSDDVYYPFNFTETFETRRFEGMDMEKEFKNKEWLLRQLLCKRCMIGSRWSLQLGNWLGKGSALEAAAYTLDTDVSYGASGGPILDSDGRLVAVTSKRGLGAASKFEIPTLRGDTLKRLPTGTTHALSHNIVTSILSINHNREA